MADNIVDAFRRVSQRLTAPDGPFACDEADICGTRLRVFRHADGNVADIFLRAEARHGSAPLVSEGDDHLTYAELFGAAARLGATLQDRFAFVPGDRIAIAMRNRAEFLQAFVAITRIGGVAVLLNSRAAPGELAAALEDVPCALVLADDERAARLGEADVSVTILDIAAIAAASAPGVRASAPVRVDRDAPAAILFTSGTTGRARGAVLTQRNFTAMVANLEFTAAATLELSAGLHGLPVETLRATLRPPVVLLMFPLFHVSGMTTFFMTIQNGGKILTMRRWRAGDALDLIERHDATMVSGPPLVMDDLLEQPAAAARLASVTSVSVGGQATPGNLVKRVREIMPRASQSAGWGMTEATGAVTSAAGPLYLERPESCGVASPLVDLRLVDEAGADVADGGTGEILVRSVLVMQGYHGAAQASAAIFDGAWLRTGDIGTIDADGFVHLVDRKKDMVICAGENIYCAEVERVFGNDPEVEEVSVFGVPDARLGERVIAAVNLREGSTQTADEMKARVRRHLADYKVPAAIALNLGAFPRNATGKVVKAELRALYLVKAEEIA